MSGYTKQQMTNGKNASSTKRIVFVSFLILLCFFSCDKSSEEAEENTVVSANTNTVEPRPTNPPPAAEEKPAPVIESIVPEQIRRPQLGEAPRYPDDIIIGTLGAGEAPAESYRFARSVLRNLLQEESLPEALPTLPPEQKERIVGILQELSPTQLRIGGGREEVDGSVSFLLRFIGANSWSGGEIYIRQNENSWDLEDLILDAPGDQNQGSNPYRFDLPPYERFF
jgi:hypothetical protein